MTTTTQASRSTRRGKELVLRRNPVVRVWSLNPWLDVLAAALVGAASGGYAGRWTATSPGVLLILAAASVFVAGGWAACIALLRRLGGVPVPGFGYGFPKRFVRSLARISWQGLLLAVVVFTLCACATAGWADLSWAVILPAFVVVALGALRFVQVARPLIHVVLRPRGRLLR